MCNCDDNNTNCYHINFGCVQPVVANADNYYTKSEVDDKIEDIATSGCCITPEEVDEKISAATEDYATKQWVEDKHYLTEHQDLSDYALKSDLSQVSSGLSVLNTEVNNLSTTIENKADKGDIPSLDGYATEQWVESQGYLKTHQSLEGYVTEGELSSYTYDKATIDRKIGEGGVFDPTNYYDKRETDNLLGQKLDASAYTPTDLSDYATKQWVESQGYLKTHQSLEGYVTEGELSSYTYTKSEIDDKIDGIVTSGCCITPEEVDDKISAATSDYATKGELSAHTSNTDIHVTALDKAYWNGKVSVTQLSNYMLKSKIWCGTISEYNSIPTKDSETIYLIHN